MTTMAGTVTTRDLVVNAHVIVREFGWGCYVRCWRRTLLSARRCTFLECI
jgi:hypothetical protein